MGATLRKPLDIQLECIKLFLFGAMRADPMLAEYFGDPSSICRHVQGRPPVVLRAQQKVDFTPGSLPCLGVYRDQRDRAQIGAAETAGARMGFRRTLYAMWARKLPRPGDPDSIGDSIATCDMVAQRLKYLLILGGSITTDFGPGEIPFDEFLTKAHPSAYRILALPEHGLECVELQIDLEHDHPCYYVPDPEISSWIVRVTANHKPDPAEAEEITINAEFPAPTS